MLEVVRHTRRHGQTSTPTARSLMTVKIEDASRLGNGAGQRNHGLLAYVSSGDEAVYSCKGTADRVCDWLGELSLCYFKPQRWQGTRSIESHL